MLGKGFARLVGKVPCPSWYAARWHASWQRTSAIPGLPGPPRSSTPAQGGWRRAMPSSAKGGGGSSPRYARPIGPKTTRGGLPQLAL